MNRLLNLFFLFLAGIAIIGAAFIPSGCSNQSGEGFAIYLTKNDIPPSQLAIQGHIDIADSPVITPKDIVAYNLQTHGLKLTATAYERLSKLQVPVSGTSFAVCVDKKIVYAGAFWTLISSQSFDGVTIWKPLSPNNPSIVTLELGYPAASYYKGEDPRNNEQILNSLTRDGKLIEKLTLESVDILPDSMKGYELYSWTRNSLQYYTIITGTNRNKTAAEIVSDDDLISETGFVNIHINSIVDLKTALGKLPSGEYVIWLNGLGAPELPSGITFKLPSSGDIDSVKSFCGTHGLKLTVPSQLGGPNSP